MKLTLKEAQKIALKLRGDIDTCEEYTHAYIFSSTNDADKVGGRGPVVIQKKDGKALNWGYYIAKAPDDDEFIRIVNL